MSSLVEYYKKSFTVPFEADESGVYHAPTILLFPDDIVLSCRSFTGLGNVPCLRVSLLRRRREEEDRDE